VELWNCRKPKQTGKPDVMAKLREGALALELQVEVLTVLLLHSLQIVFSN
jgi:hypothetical protein